MKINKILSTALAALLCFSLLGAAAATDETSMGIENYGSVDVDEKEVVLEFDLDYKDEFADTISAADFELDYGFNEMTIKSIDWEDDMAFNITLDGKIDRNYETAQVRILSSAFTDGRQNVDVTFDIVKPQMFIDYAKITLADGVLSLPVTLYQCKFEKTADVSGISLTGDAPVTISGFKKTNEKTAVIELTADGFEDIDAILKAIDKAALEGAAIAISGDILTTINGTAMNLDMPFEEAVPVIEKTAVNSDGSIQVLCRIFGYSEAIDSSLITLGGDFADEAAAFTVSDTGEILISFTVSPAKDFDIISGDITLAAGALTNPWGTPSEKLFFERNITFDDVYAAPSAETNEGAATMGYIPFEEIGEYSYMPYREFSEIEASEMSVMGVLSVIGTVGSVIGAINNTQIFGEKVAQFFGFTEAADPMAPVMQELSEIRREISTVNAMINSLTVDVAVEGAKTRINSFNEKVVSMNEFVKTFNNEVEVEIKTMLRMTDSGAALAGEYFDSLTPEEQEQAIKDFEKASVSFKADPGQTKTTTMSNLGGENSDAAIIIFSKAAQKIGLKTYDQSPFSSNFVNDYKALCNLIGGGVSQSILVDYDTIINGTYCWETEAYKYRAGYRAMLLSTLIDAGKALEICLSAYSIDYPKTDLQNAYNNTLQYVISGKGSTKDRNTGLSSNQKYSLVLNKKLSYYSYWKNSYNIYPVTEKGFGNYKNTIPLEDLKLIKIRTNKLDRTLRQDMTKAGFAVPPDHDQKGAFIIAGKVESNGADPAYNGTGIIALRFGATAYYVNDKVSVEPVKWLHVFSSRFGIIATKDFNNSYSFLSYD
ncbi:MAG: hypothetical protein LBM59_01210 [Ruminococcus sp.]|jgi:hypothetical protein|nr:hypothetical protein [Ruminococcus sp.]